MTTTTPTATPAHDSPGPTGDGRASRVVFAIQLALAGPDMQGVLGGFMPSSEIVRNPDMLYIELAANATTTEVEDDDA